MASSESVNDLPKRHTMKETKLSQLDKVSCKWFMAMCSARKPRNEHMILEKTKYYYGQSQQPRDLRRRSTTARLLRSLFKSHQGHGCLSVVSVVCCQVEVSAMS
jgi:hypothetical protein